MTTILRSIVPATYEYFCLKGGLSNELCRKIAIYNGKHYSHHIYFVDSYITEMEAL